MRPSTELRTQCLFKDGRRISTHLLPVPLLQESELPYEQAAVVSKSRNGHALRPANVTASQGCILPRYMSSRKSPPCLSLVDVKTQTPVTKPRRRYDSIRWEFKTGAWRTRAPKRDLLRVLWTPHGEPLLALTTKDNV
ncbi:hypothetical protein SKAU_G00382050 [Synaphobranchus kaupii]|uniref:Uncharacterized protein n=1 Tax=Synaphobranchus kaupii TaxID=118154 RepID=A0A9Q1EDW2_SYNKA|nr:hypothetical protein SKAU_G00382050 [Synaphobranchus kaupii]